MNLALSDAYRYLAQGEDELLKDCRQSRYQGSGPGGQKRNRVLSGIRLEHGPSGLQVSACEHREGGRNLEEAIRKLRLEMALQAEAGNEAAGGASGSKSAGVMVETVWPAFRIPVNPRHREFPNIALVALQCLVEYHGEAGAAAERLGVSTSALIRFFKTDKNLLAKAQSVRRAFGLHPFK